MLGRGEAARAMWHVYVRKGIALIPNVARTDAGFFLDVDPVRVVGLNEPQALAAAIEQAMAAGNPQVPTPTRAAFPTPVILKPARVKTWKGFVHGGACFTILRGEGGIDIEETGRDENGEWKDAPSLSQKLAASASALDIAHRIATHASQRSDLT